MPLTNAQKQARWRARRNKLAKEALAWRGYCILCLEPVADKKDDGKIILGHEQSGLICEDCVAKAAAKIAKAKMRKNKQPAKI
jgi:hypothetical protein